MFGKYIKEQRNIIGISGRTLSKKINKSATYISSIEKGLFNPDYVTACKILNELRVSIPDNDIETFLSSLGITTLNSDKEPYLKEKINKISKMSNKLEIDLSDEALEKLFDLSEKEFRTPEQQAAKILTDYLKDKK